MNFQSIFTFCPSVKCSTIRHKRLMFIKCEGSVEKGVTNTQPVLLIIQYYLYVFFTLLISLS